MKRKFVRLLAMIVTAAILGGCTGAGGAQGTFRRGLSDVAFTLASLSAVDREGREIAPMYAKKTDRIRYVGVFYWIWM